VQIRRWTTEQKEIQVDTPSKARIALRLLNYPAWRVEVNGKAVQPERMDDVNQMVIPVAEDHSDIRVRFTRTTDRAVGDTISAISSFSVVVLLWLGRKRLRKSP
jgi:hypothetical protein